MYMFLLIILLLVSIVLIGVIMLQQGKGVDMGTTFGTGASATLFGSSGSGNFMSMITTIFATLFFIISLILGNLTANKNMVKSKWENLDIDSDKSFNLEPQNVPTAIINSTNKNTNANNDVPH